MTGKFSPKDPKRCSHYARFMKHLTLPQANAVFWLLFVFVLFLMCVAAYQHHRSNTIPDIEKGLSARRYRNHVRALRRHYLGVATLCFFVSIFCVVMECFALFNIEYCDGEDLMQLYWGFWSVVQVGSLIAIMGVMVQFWIVMQNHDTPPWGVALGTPVLVFAALGWIFKSLWNRFLGRITGKKFVESESDDGDEQDSGDEKDGRDGRENWKSRPTLVQEPLGNSRSREWSLRRTSTA